MVYLPLPCIMGYLPLPLEKWIDVLDFKPENYLINFPVIKRRKSKDPEKQKPNILDCICAFDIEAYNKPDIEQAIMYIWQFQIDTEITIFGRTWSEFIAMLKNIIPVLPENTNLVIYIHNASYEFSFIKGIYDFEINDVFAVMRRKVVRFDMLGRFEFRCSYKMSNLSLRDFTNKYKVKHRKLTDYDYNIPLYYFSDLTIEQLRYCQNDVLGLVEAIRALLISEKYNLMNVPLTSTGFIRKELKQIVYNNLGYNYAKPYFPSPDLYHLMKKAFRGGDTHANRHYVDEILENVYSYDRSSSYPDVLCNCKYPITPLVKLEQENPITIEQIEKYIFVRDRALLFECKLDNLKIRNPFWGNPYLTKDKSYNIINPQVYNGRIVQADSITVAITEIDYMIIKEVYTYDITILQLYKASKGYLPDCIRNFIIKQYRYKTELKGLTGELNETLYMKSKNRINGIYGLFATDPIRYAIEYMKEDRDFHIDYKANETELFEKAKRNYWLPYQFGLWTTALARYRLYEGIKIVSQGNTAHDNSFSDFVYCDTDSVKFIGAGADFTEFNKARIADSTKNDAYAIDSKDKIHYMGVFEYEGKYDRFKTCGSKKYAYEQNGHLTVTIAGVMKKKGSEELEKAGGLEKLETGFVFNDAGGLAAKYNDMPEYEEITVEGHKVPITSNVYLYNAPYTMGETEIDERIFRLSKIELDFLLNLC